MRVARFLLLSFVPCLFALGSAPAHGAETDAYTFRGITPGVTTAEGLQASDRWGKPTKQESGEEGAQRWFYKPRGYQQAIVQLRGGRVQTVDIYLPQNVSANEAARALKLGIPVEDAQLPAAAGIGEAMPDGWEAVPYSAGRVVLYVDRDTKQARALRSYAASVFGAASAAPAPGESASAPTGRSAGLQGLDAKQRQIVTATSKILPQYHISGHPLDREIARRAIQLHVDGLDPQRLYFTRSDISRFYRGADKYPDQLRRGDLSLIYDLYKTYLQRLEERQELAEALLEGDFDFDVDEEIVFANKRDVWAEDDLELREIWRKRIKYDLLTHIEAGSDLDEARTLVARSLRQTLERWQRLDDEELLGYAVNALFQAYDPRSGYYSPQQYKSNLIQQASQMVGIGASLQQQDGYTEVVKLIAGSPSALDGRLQPGDKIVGVAQGDGEMVDIVGMKLGDAVDLIRGPEDSKVRLRVIPVDGFEARIIDLVRSKFVLQQIGSAVLDAEAAGRSGDAKVGFVYLPTVYRDLVAEAAGDADFRSTTRDMRRILADMKSQDVDVLVLDLRSNPGGSLVESMELAGQFVGQGPIIMTRNGQGKVDTYSPQTEATPWEGPLVILTNKYASGGAEIVAAAVQDYERGIVVGDETTNGNGTVGTQDYVVDVLYGRDSEQAKNDREGMGVARLTLSKFYRATGDGFQIRGVVPDVVLPSMSNEVGTTQADDPFSLEFDKVAAAQFTPADATVSSEALERIVAASAQRREKSEFFQNLEKRIDQRRKQDESNAWPLKKDEFIAMRRLLAAPDENAPTLPGIPDVQLTPYLQEVLALALDYAAEREFQAAEAALNDKRYGDALAGYRRALELDPELQRARYKLAWSLATLPSSRWRDGEEAVRHARRLCEQDGRQSWSYLLALAVAEAEAGDFDQAQAELDAALEKAPSEQRRHYSYLQRRFENRQRFSSR